MDKEDKVINKICCVVLAIVFIVMFIMILSSSGNSKTQMSDVRFTRLHIIADNEYYKGNRCIYISEYEIQDNGAIMAKGLYEQGFTYYFSAGTYFLVEEYCPICDVD